MKSGVSAAQANRAIRQEALREQLQAKGLVQKVIEDSEKLADLSIDIDANNVSRIKAANDLRLALIKKYLPDLKAVELEMPNGVEMRIKWAGDE